MQSLAVRWLSNTLDPWSVKRLGSTAHVGGLRGVDVPELLSGGGTATKDQLQRT
jgi:hypothetical protein